MGKSQSRPRLTPEELEDLQRNTYFDQDEINAFYNIFMQDYPNGRLNREEFVLFFERVFPSGNPSQFAEYLFGVFDADHNGAIDFKEFILPLSLVLRGTPDEKLQWVFSLYDIDQNGTITYDEMLQIVHSVHKLIGPTFQLPKDEDTPEKRVDKIFRAMDKNNDGRLTYEEFIGSAKQDFTIAQALSLYGGFE